MPLKSGLFKAEDVSGAVSHPSLFLMNIANAMMI
jgi:hypothetical protein